MLIVTRELNFIREAGGKGTSLHQGKLVELSPVWKRLDVPRDERMAKFLSRAAQ